MEETKDQRDLHLISLFHYIAGGIMVLFACLPLIHLSVGIAMLSGAFANPGNSQQVPEWFALIFAVVGGAGFLIGQSIAWLTIYSGTQIKKRKRYMFSFILACIMCIFAPLGTVLGIFTIIILSRESVKTLYPTYQ